MDCGFLGSEPQIISVRSQRQPASDALRAEIRQGHLGGWNVCCHRELIEFPHILPEIPETVAETERAAVNIAVARWTCAHFHTFSPGRDFQDHHDSFERATRARRHLKQQVVLVLLGAFAGAFLSRMPEILRAFGVIP